jgi:hypothetical protein
LVVIGNIGWVAALGRTPLLDVIIWIAFMELLWEGQHWKYPGVTWVLSIYTIDIGI